MIETIVTLPIVGIRCDDSSPAPLIHGRHFGHGPPRSEEADFWDKPDRESSPRVGAVPVRSNPFVPPVVPNPASRFRPCIRVGYLHPSIETRPKCKGTELALWETEKMELSGGKYLFAREELNPHTLKAALGPGILLAIVTPLLISSLSTAAASQGSSCTVSFSGNLASLQLAPMGDWTLVSSNCSVSSQASGLTTGSFTGTLTSGVASGQVSGTYSLVGSTEKVTASSTDFMLSISDAQFLGSGSAYQGMLSATGSQPLLVLGTVGQVTIG